MMAYRTGWRKTGALSWKMRYRKGRKIGLSMRVMWSRLLVASICADQDKL